MIDPIAKCRCGKLITPEEWAQLKDGGDGFHRLCPCGQKVKLGTATISFDDVKKAYEAALEEGEE